MMTKIKILTKLCPKCGKLMVFWGYCHEKGCDYVDKGYFIFKKWVENGLLKKGG